MHLAKCPVCGAKFDLKQSDSPPFCSVRCRRIDLGRWLNEEYAVPDLSDEAEPDEQEPTSEPPDEDD